MIIYGTYMSAISSLENGGKLLLQARLILRTKQHPEEDLLFGIEKEKNKDECEGKEEERKRVRVRRV